MFIYFLNQICYCIPQIELNWFETNYESEYEKYVRVKVKTHKHVTTVFTDTIYLLTLSPYVHPLLCTYLEGILRGSSNGHYGQEK